MQTFEPPEGCEAPRNGAPKRRLVVTHSAEAQREYDLSQKAFYTIGDQKQDIPIFDDSNAGCIAVIYHDIKGGAHLYDLASSNGIYCGSKTSTIRKTIGYTIDVNQRIWFGDPLDKRTIKAKLLDAATSLLPRPKPKARTDAPNGAEGALKRPLDKAVEDAAPDIPGNQNSSIRVEAAREQLEALFREHQAESGGKAEDSGCEPPQKRQRTDVSDGSTKQSATPVAYGPELPPGRVTNGSTPAKPAYGIHANGFTSTNGHALENSKHSGATQRPTHAGTNGSTTSNHVSSQAASKASTNGNGTDRSKSSGAPARATENRAPRPTSDGSSMARPAAIYGPANGQERPRQDTRPTYGPAPPDKTSCDRERGSERGHASAEMQQRSGSNGHRQVSAAGAASGSKPSKNNGKCDKCDGPHPTEKCPHFKGGRENHKDAWANYGKEHPARMGSGGGNYVLRGASVVRQPGDGSCLFHSLAFGLGNYGYRGVSAFMLRRELADFIRKHPKLEIAGDTLEEWVSWDSNTSVHAYASKMAAGRAWGGGLEIASCSLLKQANIHVYEMKGGEIRRISCFDYPEKKRPGQVPTIHILYQGGMHYDALRVGSRR